MTLTTGQTIRIRRTIDEAPLSAEDSLARFERYGSTGMVYATREDGSDAVAFASECAPVNRAITVAKRSPEPVGALQGATTTGFRLSNRAKPSKHRDGMTYAELSEASGVTVNVIKKAIINGQLKIRKLGHRSAIVEHDEAQRWMKSRGVK